MGQWPFCLCVRLGFQRKSWRGVIMESFTGSKVWLDISCLMHQHWKPCWNVNYGQLKETIVICLFRFDSGFLGWDNTSQASETLYESPRGGGGAGSISRRVRLKRRNHVFVSLSVETFSITQHLICLLLHSPLQRCQWGEAFRFQRGGGVVQFTTDAF